MLTLRCSSQNDPLDCSSSVRIDLKQNLGNSGWEEKLKFSPDCEQLIYCSIQEKFNFHQNAKSESLLTVPRTKIKCASSNPVGCLASPNTGDFARKKSTTGGKIQELWNAQFAKSPHQPGVPSRGSWWQVHSCFLFEMSVVLYSHVARWNKIYIGAQRLKSKLSNSSSLQDTPPLL